MSTDSQLATRPRASQQLATLIGMEPGAMLDAIKAQCFRTMKPENVSNEQLAAFVSIAAEMGVNPFLPDMLYAFPGSNGSIIPIMGPSGVYKKLMEHPDVDSWETVVYPEDVSQPATHAVTKIWRKGKERPLSYTALVAEWRMNSNPNWATRTRHMIGLRSLKHAARQIIHGLPYDADDREIMTEMNVTSTVEAEPATQRPAPPKRSPRGAAAVVENPPANPQAGGKTGVVVEGDFTEGPKGGAQTPAPDAQKDADAAKEAEDAKLKSDMAAREAKLKQAAPQEAAPEPTPADAPPARAFLKDGEEVTVTATVKDIGAMMGNYAKVPGTTAAPTPLVQLEVTGGFNGRLWHWDGGTADAKKNVTPNPLYVPGATLKFTLLGKLNNISKKVVNLVQKVEALEGPADEQVEMS